MNNKNWSFTELQTVEVKIFEPLLEDFLEYGINGLVRENIQNSLDARIYNGEPVRININIGEMEVEEIPGIEEVFNRVLCLEGGNAYAQETIEHMKKIIGIEKTKYITFEDNNTKGLNDETWDYYAYKKGAHYEEADSGIENSRGGSHGVGKIAANAASDVHMMYFANCDENGTMQIGGTIQLIEHEYNGKVYRSSGYFAGMQDNQFIPYSNNYSGVFEKRERGLKLIIPFLKEEYAQEVEVIRGLISNFFAAILENKLSIIVNGRLIDQDTIIDIVNDSELFNDEYCKKNHTKLYVETYLESKAIDFVIKDISKEYEFYLYFRYDEAISKGAMSIIRTIGMKIEDFKVPGHARTPYNAVLIPKSDKEDLFIKSLENESHTKLSADKIRDPYLKKNGKKFIRNIGFQMSVFINEYLEKENPTDGSIDTEDLIYSVENNFRKQLEKKSNTTMITSVGNKVKKVLIKKDENKKSTESRTKREYETKTNNIRNRDKIGEDTDKKAYTTILDSRDVNRVILNQKEIIKMDLKPYNILKQANKCNVKVEVIDGQGSISEDVFKLSQQYSQIKDYRTKTNYALKDDTVYGVEISDNDINLELELKSGSNEALKFLYSLEVN